MPNERKAPDFDQFSRWLTARLNRPAATPERFAPLQAAARAARDEFVQARQDLAPAGVEVLELMAAADRDESLPPEVTTPRGFRISLGYEEGSDGERASIGVLVTSPAALIADVEGKTVYLWSGSERFELGQFDAEGKALGTLPAGIEITASDFALGTVKLETPDSNF
jgi:hypothetical protein